MLLFISRMGIAAASNILYLSHNQVFPTLFATTAFGFCNILARTVTALTPLIVRTEQPTPILVFFLSCLITFVILFGLKLDKKQEDITADSVDSFELLKENSILDDSFNNSLPSKSKSDLSGEDRISNRWLAA